MISKKQIILGIFGTVFFLGILGAVVWRVGNLQTVFQRPKATGGAGFCVDPATTFHLICSNSACVRKRGAGNNQGGCAAVGAACGSGTNIACGSATISSNTLSSGGSVTITGTATENAVGFTYGFYNLDNLYGPNNPKPIFFDGNTQYAPSHTVSPRITDTLTVNFSDINRSDNNAGGAKPTRIQVNVFFADAAGNSTHSDAKCVVQFAVTTVATGCTTDPDCSGVNVCAFP